jgi:hypothetical protein
MLYIKAYYTVEVEYINPAEETPPEYQSKAVALPTFCTVYRITISFHRHKKCKNLADFSGFRASEHNLNFILLWMAAWSNFSTIYIIYSCGSNPYGINDCGTNLSGRNRVYSKYPL